MNKIVLVLFFLSLTFLHCKDDDTSTNLDDQTPLIENDYTWTVMFWLNGDGNLEKSFLEKIPYLQQYNFNSDEIAVIALIDRNAGYYEGEGNWTGVKVYKIDYVEDSSTIQSTELDVPSLGITAGSDLEISMDDAENLKKYVEFCQENYSADHYFLQLSNHGLTWAGETEDSVKTRTGRMNNRAMGWDETGNKDDYISDRAFAGALNNKNIDIIYLESCLMGSIESLYAFRHTADYFISSPELMYAANEKEDGAWQALVDNYEITPEDLTLALMDGYKKYYDEYEYQFYAEGQTLGIYKLDQIGTVVDVFNNNISGYDSKNDALYNYRISGHQYGYDTGMSYLFDFYEFAETVDDTELQTALDNLIVESYMAGEDTDPNCISFFFPGITPHDQWLEYSSIYRTKTDFAEATQWDEFLNNFIITHPLDPNYVSMDSYIFESRNIKTYLTINNEVHMDFMGYTIDYVSTGVWLYLYEGSNVTITQNNTEKFSLNLRHRTNSDESYDGENLDFTPQDSNYYYLSIYSYDMDMVGYDYPIDIDLIIN